MPESLECFLHVEFSLAEFALLLAVILEISLR